MTDEEKKEFEEFLKWKAEKKEKEKKTDDNNSEISVSSNGESSPIENQETSGDTDEKKGFYNPINLMLLLVGIIIISIVFVFIYVNDVNNKKNSTNNYTNDYVAADSDSTAVPNDYAETNESYSSSQWKYHSKKDAMRGTTDYTAMLYSDYNMDGGSMDGGNMYIVVRKSKKFELYG